MLSESANAVFLVSFIIRYVDVRILYQGVSELRPLSFTCETFRRFVNSNIGILSAKTPNRVQFVAPVIKQRGVFDSGHH